MPNKTRNIEAVRIYRPLATGQVHTDTEAVIVAIVHIVFGEDLLPPANPKTLWQGGRK